MRTNRIFFSLLSICLINVSQAQLDEPEYIKSIASEKSACINKLKKNQPIESAEHCRAWVTLAPDAIEKSDALGMLGQAYATAGDVEEAQASFDEAAQYLQKQPGPVALEKWVQTQAMRARLAEGRDQMDAADLIYLKTVDWIQRKEGSKHLTYALACENRAAFLARTGDLSTATQLFIQAVAAYDELFGPYNERSLETILNLAVAQLDAKQAESARKTLLTLYNAMKLGKRENTEGAAEALTFLGNLAAEQQTNDKALNYFQKAIEIREKVHGKNDLRTAQSYNSAGLMHAKLGNAAQAEALLAKAYVIRREALGEDEPRTQDTLTTVRALIEVQRRETAKNKKTGQNP
jgi:tetratricopeptide (TPR) repeat protein